MINKAVIKGTITEVSLVSNAARKNKITIIKLAEDLFLIKLNVNEKEQMIKIPHSKSTFPIVQQMLLMTFGFARQVKINTRERKTLFVSLNSKIDERKIKV